MLGLGWAELMVVGAVLIFTIGPQELPGLMRGLGRLVRRITYMKHAMGMQLDQMMGTVDPQEVNTTMKPKMYDESGNDTNTVPEIDPEQEHEANEDEGIASPEAIFTPQSLDQDEPVMPSTDAPLESAEEARVKKDQQDLFAPKRPAP